MTLEFPYSTSLRARSIDVTLERARDWGTRLGISRVTDITRLDRIGIPVCVSIRPGAMPGSLCVNAGKGATPEEARVGAWMEGIEYAIAEPGASPVEIVTASARAVLDGTDCNAAVLDFCPRRGAKIPLDDPMDCVSAEELLSNEAYLVPAELVFLPAPAGLCGAGWFGSSSVGLASGSTRMEATVHGLAEAIEHDITSFHNVHDTSFAVDLDSFPAHIKPLCTAIHAAGLELFVRCCPNVFGLPCFQAVIHAPESSPVRFLHGGYGCHPHRSIALVRALCEAAQSRLCFIHGGRDDLADAKDVAGYADRIERRYEQLTRRQPLLDLAQSPDLTDDAPTLESCFNVLLRCLKTAGLRRVCRVAFTPPSADLQVVRILVPGLEQFDAFSNRAGRRLCAYADSL